MIDFRETPFRLGFLMGMEAAATGDTIMAPGWVERDEKRIREFNKGVTVAYGLWSILTKS